MVDRVALQVCHQAVVPVERARDGVAGVELPAVGPCQPMTQVGRWGELQKMQETGVAPGYARTIRLQA